MDRIQQVQALQALGLEPLAETLSLGNESDYKVSVVLNDRLFCIAFDPKDGFVTLANLENKYGKMPETWCQITPDGGLQYYFKGIMRSKHCKDIGVEIMGKGTSVITSDVDYAWQLNRAPGECELAQKPEWWDGFVISHHFVEAPFVLSVVPSLPSNVSLLNPVQSSQKIPAPTFPIPSGIWGEVYDVCMERAKNPVPEFAMAASSAIMSAVLQRTVVPHQNGNVNAYIYAFATQAGGKAHYINFVLEVLDEVNKKLILPRTSSASALQEMLAEYPSGITVTDEASKAFKSVFGTARQQDALAEGKHSLLLTLWGEIKSLPGVKVRAKGMSIPTVNYPRYSEFGVGILEEFDQVLASDVAQRGGFLSRIEPYVSKKEYFSRMKPMEQMVAKGPIPQSLIDKLIALQGSMEFLTEEAGNVPVPQTRPLYLEPAAFKCFEAIEETLIAKYRQASQAWQRGWFLRAGEKIERDATKHAAGRNLSYVSVADVKFAEAKYLAHEDTFFSMMTNAPCSDFDACRNDVLRILSEHGPMTKSALRAKSFPFKKMNPKLQKELLDDLQDTVEIAITDKKNGHVIGLVKGGK